MQLNCLYGSVAWCCNTGGFIQGINQISAFQASGEQIALASGKVEVECNGINAPLVGWLWHLKAIVRGYSS